MGFSMKGQIQILGRMTSGEDAPKAPTLARDVREGSGSGGSLETGGIQPMGRAPLRQGRRGLQGVPQGQGRLGRQGEQMAAEGAAVAIVVMSVLPAAGHAGGLRRRSDGRGGGLLLRSCLRGLGDVLGLRLMAVIMRPMGHGAGRSPERSQHQKADEHQTTQHGETI